MGVAYILLLNKKKAGKCFEKACEIKPDYEMAKKKLEIIDNVTTSDLKILAKEFRAYSNSVKEDY